MTPKQIAILAVVIPALFAYACLGAVVLMFTRNPYPEMER